MNRKLYLSISQAALLATALAKLYSATGNQGALGVVDPVFGLRYRSLFVAVGSLEFAVVFLTFLLRRRPLIYFLPGWLGVNFLVYRLLYALSHPVGLCPCLGTLASKLHMPDRFADVLLWGTALFLFVGSLLAHLNAPAATGLGRGAGAPLGPAAARAGSAPARSPGDAVG